MQSIYKNNTGHLLTQDEPPVFLPQKDNEKTFYRWYRLILLTPYDLFLCKRVDSITKLKKKMCAVDHNL